MKSYLDIQLLCCLTMILSLACPLGSQTSGQERAESTETARKKNVLFIAADDLRTDLACYGHSQVKTPYLDQLAEQGTLFRYAYCQQALCNPSRASLMTGRRPDSLGIWNLPTHFREIDPTLVTLPQYFKQHGYYTQNIGKIFHNWRQEIQGDPRSWSVPAVMHYATHGSDTPKVSGPLPPDHAQAPRCERRDVPDDAYFDGRIASLAVDALEELKQRNEPFFLAVGFWKPHLPFNPPKKYWDLYDRETITLPADPNPPRGVPEVALHNGRELLRRDGQIRTLTTDEVRELRHGYLAGISYLDAQIGCVLEQLDQLGLRDNTVVVFWSDHGFHLGEHSLWCKTSNFELDAHVPLLIYDPRIHGSATKQSAGGKCNELVELLDLYPTLVDLCGLDPAEGVEGKSLAPLLQAPTKPLKPETSQAAYTQHPRPAYYQREPEVMGVSVRTPKVRYTEWRDFRTGRVEARELYNHIDDPDETRNIVDRPDQRDTVRHAQVLLEAKFPRRGYGG